MEPWRVEVENYYGPLEVLLYLVRKAEVNVLEVPLRQIIQQCLDHFQRLLYKDLGEVGELLILISTLLELKSQFVLPQQQLQWQKMLKSSRPLLLKLLQYRRLREITEFLALQEMEGSLKFCRPPMEVESRLEPAEAIQQALAEIDVFHLSAAYERIRSLEGTVVTLPSEEVPIEEIMHILAQRLQKFKRAEFWGLLVEGDRHWIAGAFIAILELMRQGVVRAVQEEPFGELWLYWQEEKSGVSLESQFGSAG